MSAPVRPRPTKVPADCVQLLRAEVYTAAGNSLADLNLAYPVEWVMLVGGRLEFFSTDAMTPQEAAWWAEGATGATLVESDKRDDRGYWVGTIPADPVPEREPAAAIENPPEPEPDPEPEPAPRPSWRKRKAEPAPEPTPEPPDEEEAVEAEPRPSLSARLTPERWPRFMTEQPPSFAMAVDYAKRGGWSQHPGDTPPRAWHVGWAYAMTPLLAFSTWLGWACMRPGRLLPSLGLLALTAWAVVTLIGGVR